MTRAFWRGVGSILGLFPRRRTYDEVLADVHRDIDAMLADHDATLRRCRQGTPWGAP